MIILERKESYRFDKNQLTPILLLLNRIAAKENNRNIKLKIFDIIEIFNKSYRNTDEISKVLLLTKKKFSGILNSENMEEGIMDIFKKKHISSKKFIKKFIVALGLLASFASCDIMNMSSESDIFDANSRAFYNQSSDGVYYIRLDESFVNDLIGSLKEYEKTLDATVLKKYSIDIKNIGEDGFAGKYSTVSKDIIVNSYLPNSYWFSVLVHELTHKKQDDNGIGEYKGLNFYAAYITNPMEINANFNSLLYLSKLDDVEDWKYSIVMGDDVLVSVLLTYRIDRNYNYTNDDEIIKVHSYVKDNFPSAYKDFNRIKDNESLIKSYFGM